MGDFAHEEPVAKGPVTYCLDQMSELVQAERHLQDLSDAISGLSGNNFEGLEEVFGKYLFAPVYGDRPDLIEKMTGYLHKCWFGPSSKDSYFPDSPNIARIYAVGILKTIDLSLKAKSGKPLPIDSWWQLDYPRIAMINLVSKRQVTLIIATPAPALPTPAGIWGEEAEAWLSDERTGMKARRIAPPRTPRPRG